MSTSASPSDKHDRPYYVRVVLAHKDWLAGTISAKQLSQTLEEVARQLEKDRERLLARHRDEAEDMLEIVADAMAEGVHGLDMMLAALEHGDKPGVMDGLTALARATSAVQEGEKHFPSAFSG